MQLHIKIKLADELILPISYHHIQQSVIYNLLKNGKFNANIHDEGANYEKRIYKLFTFGAFVGQYTIVNKSITFTDDIKWEIRSGDTQMINCLADSIKENGIELMGQELRDISIQINDDTVEDETLYIKMLSPICVYNTERDTKRTHFYSPFEAEFAKAVAENFERKYTAATSNKPEKPISIEAVDIKSSDKYVTTYKNFYITGWKGTYKLSGKRKYLDFLYQTGLGGKNSQGFGMFEICDERSIK